MIKKKIIIIDDEPLIPSLIKELLEDESELEISEIASSKEAFLDQVSKKVFDVALIDISIGKREGGIDLLRTLKDQGIKLPIVILSAHDEISYAAKCLSLGAAGYINKAHICSDLILGLNKVLDGGLYVSGYEGERILKKHKELTNTPAS